MNDNNIINGDCIEELKKLPDNSIDAIITDPPYGLEFMGKDWDKFKQGLNIGGGTTGIGTPYGRSKPLVSLYQLNRIEKQGFQDFTFNWATECLRVLKPGAYLLSFGGTRTYHRMACGIEDAGFEIRDCIMWLYGSGFPKSLNIGKQIEKLNPAKIVYGEEKKGAGTNNFVGETNNLKPTYKEIIINNEWEGWGTALKPACEPIVVARKPLSEKNVALNVLKWGTGGINIDACRIGTEPIKCSNDIRSLQKWKEQDGRKHKELVNPEPTYNQGRFPANIILDEEAGEMLDEQSGINNGGKFSKGCIRTSKENIYELGFKKKDVQIAEAPDNYGDKGGASRFFYCAKASKSERNYGCDELEEQERRAYTGAVTSDPRMNHEQNRFPTKNNHPTVKPVALMEYLIKLVSRENAIVLDPFLGSGTTAIACLKTNRKFIGIEKEPEYVKIAQARIKPYLEQIKLLLPEEKQDE